MRNVLHPHPSTMNMTKEEYLEGIGLVSVESLKSQTEVKRVERRRRTTANPKYNSNGFVELRQLTKRTRRFEEADSNNSSNNSSSGINNNTTNNNNNCIKPIAPKRMTLNTTAKQIQALPKCYICEQTKIECNLTCETCQTQYHDDCIRVSGSKAPCPPSRIPVCPQCISAKLQAYKLSASSLPLTKISENNSKSTTFSSSASKSQQFVSTSSSTVTAPLTVQKNKLNSMPSSTNNNNSGGNKSPSNGQGLKFVSKSIAQKAKVKKRAVNHVRTGLYSKNSNNTTPTKATTTTTTTTTNTQSNSTPVKSLVPKKTKRAMKSKTSPRITVNGSSISRIDFNSCTTRLSLFSAISGDQSLNKTIIAMSDAAKIVMAGNRLAAQQAAANSAASSGADGVQLTTTTATITATATNNLLDLHPLNPMLAKKSITFIPSFPPPLSIKPASSSSLSLSSSSSCDNFKNMTSSNDDATKKVGSTLVIQS